MLGGMSFHFQVYTGPKKVPYMRLREKRLQRRGKEMREVVSTFGPAQALLDSGQLASMLRSLTECAQKIGMDVALTGSLRRGEIAPHEEQAKRGESDGSVADGTSARPDASRDAAPSGTEPAEAAGARDPSAARQEGPARTRDGLQRARATVEHGAEPRHESQSVPLRDDPGGDLRTLGEGTPHFTPDEIAYLRSVLRWRERTLAYTHPRNYNLEDLKEKLRANPQPEEAC